MYKFAWFYYETYSSKGSNSSYNVTKSSRFNIKSKNQPIIEDVEEEEIEAEEEETDVKKDECERSELEYKPVIYLYPEESIDIFVQLNFEKRIFTTIYPKFNGKNT